MGICRKHKITFVMCCLVCEVRSDYMILPDNYVESFDSGFNGIPFSTLDIEEAYNHGKECKKYVEER